MVFPGASIMYLHLPSLPTTVISSHRTKDRIPPILSMLHGRGHNRITVTIGGDAHPYWLALREQMRQALTQPCPFILLQDDARETPEYEDTLTDVPDKTEILYLGTTEHTVPKVHPYGWRTQQTHEGWPSLIYWELGHRYVQIGNMLSAHAIVFLKDDARDHFRQSLQIERPDDISFAEAQLAKFVVAKRHPIYYQQDGHNDDTTRVGIPFDCHRD